MPLVSGASYATVAQFFGPGGLPQTALGSRSVADVQEALDTSTSDMDSLAFRGVYGPGFLFSSVGLDVARRCVQHARFLFLGGQRGYDPQAGADTQIQGGDAEFLAWCDRVHRRAEFPDVIVFSDSQHVDEPLVVSRGSVINDLGQRAATRGW